MFSTVEDQDLFPDRLAVVQSILPPSLPCRKLEEWNTVMSHHSCRKVEELKVVMELKVDGHWNL